MTALAANWEIGSTAMNKKYHPQTDNAKELRMIDGELVMIDSGDKWFWTDEWQSGELRVDQDIKNGKIEEFSSMEDFLSTL
jgi:hypothetical protein